jgi:hypothetical protein
MRAERANGVTPLRGAVDPLLPCGGSVKEQETTRPALLKVTPAMSMHFVGRGLVCCLVFGWLCRQLGATCCSAEAGQQTKSLYGLPSFAVTV